MAYSGAYRASDWEPAETPGEEIRPNRQVQRPAPQGNDGLAQRLLPLLKKLEAIDLETEDLLLLLILYLMYRESGEKELLIMMGAMLFT